MNVRYASAIRALAVAGAVLSGCAGASTRLYTLDPMAPARTVPYAGPPIRVDAVHIPPAYDRAELVREMSAGRILLGDNDHWAAPLGDLMRRALTQDLVARLPAGSVIFPDSPKPPGSSGLVIDVLAISELDGSIAMDVSWTIVPSQGVDKGRAPPRILRNRDRLTAPAASPGLRDTAAYLSELLGQASDRIAADLSRNG